MSKMGCVAVVSLLLAGVAATPAEADTAVPGSEYDVTFSGTGTAHITSTSHDNGDGHLTNSADQSASWNAVDNQPAEVWLPAASNPAEEGAFDSATTQTSPPPGKVSATVTQTGVMPDPNSAGTIPYSCQASQLYDNGVATVTAGVNLGQLTVTTNYATPGRGFESGTPGGQFLPDTFTCNPTDALPYANVDYSDQIAYGAGIPFTSVGQSQITLTAADQSTIPACTPGFGPGDTCTGPDFKISGSYTLQKQCDGTITYSGDTLTGKCGSGGKEPPDTKITKSKVSGKKRKATFKFKGVNGTPPYTFKCELDGSKFKRCSSPATFKHLKKGKHVFEVEAIDSTGAVDPSPAKQKFKF